ncbi:MAG: FkbM family methyltransferase [Salibacteraceae bacterium]
MASVNSPIRRFVKPLFYKILGRRGYKFVQARAKIRDIQHRLVEEKEMVLLPEFIKEGDHVLDLGANYAYYIERMSRLVGVNGRVFGFEPIPFTFEVCALVVKKLGLKNIDIFPFASGNANETLEFRVPKLDFGGISAGQSHLSKRNNEMEGKENYYSFNDEELVKCQAVTIDDYLLSKLKNLSFVKIDIEGAEYFALQGMKKTIEKFKPVILVEIQPFFLKGMGVDEATLVELLKKDFGYQIFAFNKANSKLKIVETNLWDDNYILIHSGKVKDFEHLIL